MPAGHQAIVKSCSNADNRYRQGIRPLLNHAVMQTTGTGRASGHYKSMPATIPQ